MNVDPSEIMRNIGNFVKTLLDKTPPSGSRDISINDNLIQLETSTGTVRKENQDKLCFTIIENQFSTGSQLAVATLADGMGGMVGGQEAASIAISSFLSFLATGRSDKGLKDLAHKAIKYANDEVYSIFNGNGGSTLSAIVFGKNGCVAVNIGDSRIYSIDKFSGLKQLSQDDTIAGQLKREEDSLNDWLYPDKADNRLAQHVGMGPGINVHCIDLFEYYKQNNPNMGFLLTSDGAHYLGNLMLNKIVQKSERKNDITLIISKISNWLSGHDNISLISLPTYFDFLPKSNFQSDLSLKIHTIQKETNLLFPLSIQRNDYHENLSIKLQKMLKEEIENKISKAREEIKKDILKEVSNLEKDKSKRKKPDKIQKNTKREKIEKKQSEPIQSEKKDQIKLDFISIGKDSEEVPKNE